MRVPLCYTLSLSVFSLKEEIWSSPPELDPWDLDRLRLPAELVGDVASRRRPPRHRSGDPFIKGPIPYAWIASACRLPGAGLHVAMAFRFYRGRFRFKPRERRWGLSDVAKGLRISDDSARRGLHAAELAGLLAVEREPGCKLAVSVLDLPEPESRPERRPLYGPIPGAGGSRPPGSLGSPSKLGPSVGCLPVGSDRPISSWRWRVGRISASPGSRPPGAWMSWNGPSWSPSAGRQAGPRSLLSWTSGPGRAYPESGELKGA